jgi:hypothetical protein
MAPQPASLKTVPLVSVRISVLMSQRCFNVLYRVGLLLSIN